jgi:phosphoglycolate phosphatase-like HAD superfamily hydrolase
MREKKYARVALFDCDKTLVEITGITNRALSDALHSQFGVRGDLTMLNRNEYCGISITQVIVHVLQKAYEHKNKTIALEDIEFSKFVRCKDAYEDGLVKRLRRAQSPRKLLTDGAYKFLAALNNAGIPVGVYTGGLESVVGTALRATGIRRYVDAFTSGSNRMDAIRRCVNGLEEEYGMRVKPRDVAVFGDSLNDMKNAAEYGAVPIGIIGASEYDEKELRAAGAKYIYDNFHFYKAILLEIFGRSVSKR